MFFPARARRLDGHREVFFDLRLPDEFLQAAGPQLQFERRIVEFTRDENNGIPSDMGLSNRMCDNE